MFSSLINLDTSQFGSLVKPKTNIWSTANKLAGATSIGGLGKLLGGGLGTALAGPFGALISPLTNIIGNLFGGSPPTKFAEAARTFLSEWLPQIQTKYAQNPEQLLTEMSKAYNYMIGFYTAHIAGAKSKNSKEGTRMGMDLVRSFEVKFMQFIGTLNNQFNVTYVTIQTTFDKNQHPNIRPHSGSHTGSYKQFTVVQKNVVEKVTDKISGATKSVQMGLGGASSIVVFGLLLAVFTGKLKMPKMK